MNKILSLSFLLLLSKFSVNAQYIVSGSEINASQLSPWKSSFKKEYVGNYSFGFSESESTLEIKIVNSIYSAKLIWGEWDNKGQWKNVIKTLSNVNISNGRFYSNQFYGNFVYVSLPNNSNSTIQDTTSAVQTKSSYQGLQILSEWNVLGKNEIGLKKDY